MDLTAPVRREVQAHKPASQVDLRVRVADRDRRLVVASARSRRWKDHVAWLYAVSEDGGTAWLWAWTRADDRDQAEARALDLPCMGRMLWPEGRCA
jgi:hypothetical protein